MPVKPHDAEVVRLPQGTIYIGKKPEPRTPEPQTAAVTPDRDTTPAVSTPQEKSRVQRLVDDEREMRAELARHLADQEPFFSKRADELDAVLKTATEVGIHFDPLSEDDLRQLSEAIAYEDDFHDPHWYEIRGSASPYRALVCIELDYEFHVHYFKVAPRRWFPKFWKITWQAWYYAKDAIDCGTPDDLLKHIIQKHLK